MILRIFRTHLNAVFALGITLIFLCLSFSGVGNPGRLDLGLYDLMMNWKPVPPGKNDIVLVEIDDHAIERIGPWPWSRALIARGLEKIGLDHPKAVGLDFVFEMPEINTALNELEGLEELFKRASQRRKALRKPHFWNP